MNLFIKVLIAKLGLDGHDRGALIIAQSLKDMGAEVIYSGLKNMPEAIAEIAVQEDVDVVGISILSGAHLVLIPSLMEELTKLKADDIPVVVGGVIPPSDIKKLKAFGVREVFLPGTSIKTAASFLIEEGNLHRKRSVS